MSEDSASSTVPADQSGGGWVPLSALPAHVQELLRQPGKKRQEGMRLAQEHIRRTRLPTLGAEDDDTGSSPHVEP